MDTAFFLELSRAARVAIAGASRQPSNKASGSDFDPVTEADKAAERALRALIEERFPEHGIWGEEYGWSREDADRHWSLDPIDGTRAFVCGLPSWAVLVGHLEGGSHVAGMIDLPALGETLVALDGETRRGDEPVRTSGRTLLSEARVATTDPGILSDSERERFMRLYAAAPLTRYGLDAFAYARIATGDIDLVCETGLKKHDLDALVPVVRGAGGFVGNWQGGNDLSGGDLVAAATRDMYDAAIAELNR